MSYAERVSDRAVAHALRRMADRLDPPELPAVPEPTMPARPMPAGVEIDFQTFGMVPVCRLCGWRGEQPWTMRADAIRQGAGHRCGR